MPNKLKTTYELSLQRVLMPNYSKKVEKEMLAKNTTNYSLDSIPDFVNDVKSPTADDYIEEYSNAFIEKSQKKETKTFNDNIEMKKSETIYFDRIPNLHWYGNFTSYTGFSKMNRAMVFGLCNKNINIKIDMQNCPLEVNQSTLNELERLRNNQIPNDAPKVFGATVPLNPFHHGKKILYTMMENSETLHSDYIDKLNMFNEIWVPTYFNKDLFKKNNIKPPIYVMPLGVDIERYNLNVKPFDFKFDLNEFVFISVFKWNYRKGWDLLLKAFLEEFDSSEPVSLLIVSRTDVHHNRKTIIQDFLSVKNIINKKTSDLPHIALYDEPIKEKDMPNIYKRANAFALISRGEGFGLPYCEAAACGLPIIASNCSGQMDYLNENNSFLVNPESYGRAEITGNMSKLAKHCRFYENQIFPEFKTNSVNSIKNHMRYVYENYNEALKKSQILTRKIHQDFSWDASINKVYKRLISME